MHNSATCISKLYNTGRYIQLSVKTHTHDTNTERCTDWCRNEHYLRSSSTRQLSCLVTLSSCAWLTVSSCSSLRTLSLKAHSSLSVCFLLALAARPAADISVTGSWKFCKQNTAICFLSAAGWLVLSYSHKFCNTTIQQLDWLLGKYQTCI